MNRLRKKATQAVGWRKESAHEEEKNRKVFVPWLQHKRKALNNDEKQQIKKSLSDLWLQVTTAISLANVCKQLPNSNLNLNVSGTIVFLAEHMYQMFVTLWNYMMSVWQWRNNICISRSNGTGTVAFSCGQESGIIIVPADFLANEVVSVCSQWSNLRASYSLEKSDAKFFWYCLLAACMMN